MSAALVWFRRDLRDYDHAALAAALERHERVYCAFCFDSDILDALPRADRRVEFILASLRELDAALAASGGGLIVLQGRTLTVPDMDRLKNAGLFNSNYLHLDHEGRHLDAND